YVQTGHFHARNGPRELVKQEALATADVQDAVARLQAVVLGHSFGNRQPATIVVVAAVAVLPLAVPVVLTVFLGDLGTGCLVVLNHAGDVVALGPIMEVADEVYVSHR